MAAYGHTREAQSLPALCIGRADMIKHVRSDSVAVSGTYGAANRVIAV